MLVYISAWGILLLYKRVYILYSTISHFEDIKHKSKKTNMRKDHQQGLINNIVYLRRHLENVSIIDHK